MTAGPRECAKFLSGAEAAEALGHWWLGVWGRDTLPRRFLWFAFTDEWIHFATAILPLVLAAIVDFAWLRPARVAMAALVPTSA